MEQKKTDIITESLDALINKEQQALIDFAAGIKVDNPDQGIAFATHLMGAVFKNFIELKLDERDDESDEHAPSMIVVANQHIDGIGQVFHVHAFGPKNKLGNLYIRLGKKEEMKQCVAAHIGAQIGKKLNKLFHDEALTPEQIEEKIEALFDKSVEEIVDETLPKLSVEFGTVEPEAIRKAKEDHINALKEQPNAVDLAEQFHVEENLEVIKNNHGPHISNELLDAFSDHLAKKASEPADDLKNDMEDLKNENTKN